MGLVDTNEAVEHFRRVIEATENNGAYNEGFIDALEFCIATLSTMPTAELIHCKDCEWWTKQDKSIQGRCELMQMYPTGGWFCGNAQKRVSKDEKQ